VAGAALGGAGVLWPWRAWGLLLIAAPAALLPDPAKLEAAMTAMGCLAGPTTQPGGVGLAVRLLGPAPSVQFEILAATEPVCWPGLNVAAAR
jgi:hypothetical protein